MYIPWHSPALHARIGLVLSPKTCDMLWQILN
jgi:hypothetical protein